MVLLLLDFPCNEQIKQAPINMVYFNGVHDLHVLNYKKYRPLPIAYKIANKAANKKL